MKLIIHNSTAQTLVVNWGRTRFNECLPAGKIAPDSELSIDSAFPVNQDSIWVVGRAESGEVYHHFAWVEDGDLRIVLEPQHSSNLTGPLTLPEELLLLSIDDVGRQHSVTRNHLDLGLMMAAIAELLLEGRLELEGSSVHVKAGAEPTGVPALDDVLEILGSLGKQPIGEILKAVAERLGFLHDHILEGLVARGVLQRRDSRLLGLIPSWFYATADPQPESALTIRILKALTTDWKPDRRTSILLAIVTSCFTSELSLKEQLYRELRDRMYAVVNCADPLVTEARAGLGVAMAELFDRHGWDIETLAEQRVTALSQG
jgi:hypothetical protein